MYWHLLSRKRIGLAVADSPYGPWTRISDPDPVVGVATEGFDAVHCVTSEAEVAALLTRWGAAPPQPPPLGLFKFPRTRHVLNTGGTAVSRDDLVMDAADARRFFDGWKARAVRF